MPLNRRSWLRSLALSAVFRHTGAAQSKPSKADIAGDYAGVLAGALHLKLHIAAAPDGALTGTLDSLDQGAMGIPCAGFQLEGNTLTFRIPAVNGVWKGALSADGTTLAGTWDQGTSMPLTFTRDTFLASAKPSAADGIWLGAVQSGGLSTRAQIQIKSDRAGREFCTFDSLDQGLLDSECAGVTLNGSAFSFAVPKLGGRWSGKLSPDGQTLAGAWTGDATFPLDFSRQTARAAPAPATAAPMPPVKAAALESVLDRDLVPARLPIFKPGPLSAGSGAGVAIGVVQHGVRRVFAFGEAKPDSIFEIGSLTKSFTALLLARMAARGEVTLDQPVRELLPADTASPGAPPKPGAPEITLLDLATQHSGLPRLPGNLPLIDLRNPYAAYHPAELYRFMNSRGFARPAAPEFLYSNLGFGLLGQALANRAGKTYAALLHDEITAPLALHDTVVSLSPQQQARFIPGHDADRHPAAAWDFDALAGAGAIRSTAADMLTYLEAQLHPEKFPALAPAIAQTHQLRAAAMPGMRIALAWLYVDRGEFYWHNGGTGGFSSYAFFDPKNDCAAIVLSNTAPGTGSFADLLGAHIRRRLLGESPLPLGR